MDQFIFLAINLQQTAAIISYGGGLLVVGVVIFLISSSSQGGDKMEAKHQAYHVRKYYFTVLTLTLLALIFVSFRFVPYESHQPKADMDVTVVGMQWYWKMAEGISDASPSDMEGENEIDLPVNKNIRFHVSSMDVNHDFAIYDSTGLILAQTMAMPQYTNQLTYKFKHPGKYEVVCLEYCGAPHAFMTATINIK